MNRVRSGPARGAARSAPESWHSGDARRKCLIREEKRAMRSGHYAISGMRIASNGATPGRGAVFFSLLFKSLKKKEKRPCAAGGRTARATPRVAAVLPCVGADGRAARHESGARHVSDAWRHTVRNPFSLNTLRTRYGDATSPCVALRVRPLSGRRGGRR
jgi:hypothetical protein